VELHSGQLQDNGTNDEQAPVLVTVVPRLPKDVATPEAPFHGPHPSVSWPRVSSSLTVCYLMGDASRKGVSFAIWDHSSILWELSLYKEIMHQESSNFQLADNLISRLKVLESDRSLEASEEFIFMDHSAFE
jgi:hypothetical protein